VANSIAESHGKGVSPTYCVFFGLRLGEAAVTTRYALGGKLRFERECAVRLLVGKASEWQRSSCVFLVSGCELKKSSFAISSGPIASVYDAVFAEILFAILTLEWYLFHS
jgi:hypothetical protein